MLPFYEKSGERGLKLIWIQKKSKLSVLIVLPNCHFYVDMHKHCNFKQHFASNHFDNIAFPLLHQMLNCWISRCFIISFLLFFSHLVPLLLPGDSWCQHPTMYFSRPSFVVHCLSCFCTFLLGYFMDASKSLLPSPLLGSPQGSWCQQLGCWWVVTAANMVPQSPCAPLSASICSSSSCARDVLVCLSLSWGNGRRAEVPWFS